LEIEGWKALAKNIGDRQLAKDFARYLLDLENLPSDVQSKWRALLSELENDHQPKEFVLILIKIYNNRSILLPLEVAVRLQDTNKYPDLVESILEHENPSSKLRFIIKCKSNFKKGTFCYLENATSIHLAALYGLTGVVEKLSKKYDDPMVKETNTGKNAIHLAALNGHLNIVKHLMSFTNVPLAPDKSGFAPIDYAVGNGNLDTVKFLIGLTNKPNKPSNFGLTPIENAKLSGNVEVQKFLEDYCK
jgi:ankyrin repeat protein